MLRAKVTHSTMMKRWLNTAIVGLIAVAVVVVVASMVLAHGDEAKLPNAPSENCGRADGDGYSGWYCGSIDPASPAAATSNAPG